MPVLPASSIYKIWCTCFICLVILSSCFVSNEEVNNGFPVLSGPYLGQSPPDTLPELFAPGIIGTGMFTRDIAMPPSMDEIFYCVGIGNYTYSTILYTKMEGNTWTKPAVVPFATSGKVFDFEPAFSPDGNRLYFLSARADLQAGSGTSQKLEAQREHAANEEQGEQVAKQEQATNEEQGEQVAHQEQEAVEEPGDQDIWYVDRTSTGWGEPVNPGAPLNSDGGEFFPSVTRDSFLYFTHNDKGSGLNQIFRSRIYADRFGSPELLPEEVNCGTNRFNAFIAPDHTYAIVPAVGMEDAYDQVDYYITFRNASDQWSRPINLGPTINKDNTRGWSPYVSPDGKYFFFMANWSEEVPAAELTWEKLLDLHNSPRNGNSDIYWIKADFISALRIQAIFDHTE